MYLIPLLVFLSSLYGIMLECNVTKAKTILEGCSKLSGLTVIAGGKTTVNDSDCGAIKPVSLFILESILIYPKADPKALYTIMILDADAPFGPFFLHLLKSNVNGTALITKGGSITAGIVLACNSVVFGSSLQCSVTEVKSLLEGCDRLLGLNVTAVGGTIVDDHNCDVLLPKQVFFDEPLFQYSLADSKKFYTLIMADPDAPPQLDGEFFVHMLKSNIPGLALKAKESVKTVGVDYRPYKPPTPPHGSGAHRYISLLYEQVDGNNFLPNVPPSRNRFALADWLRGKNLCGPVAATQFRTQY